jgi:hypothetical protein
MVWRSATADSWRKILTLRGREYPVFRRVQFKNGGIPPFFEFGTAHAIRLASADGLPGLEKQGLLP